MKENTRIPLELRLLRLRAGQASDPAFVLYALRKVMKIPLSAYFYEDPSWQDSLGMSLMLTDSELKRMTFGDLVWRIYCRNIHRESGKGDLGEALTMLASPICRSQRERMDYHG